MVWSCSENISSVYNGHVSSNGHSTIIDRTHTIRPSIHLFLCSFIHSSIACHMLGPVLGAGDLVAPSNTDIALSCSYRAHMAEGSQQVTAHGWQASTMCWALLKYFSDRISKWGCSSYFEGKFFVLQDVRPVVRFSASGSCTLVSRARFPMPHSGRWSANI